MMSGGLSFSTEIILSTDTICLPPCDSLARLIRNGTGPTLHEERVLPLDRTR
jgi:hypothetical protein